MNNMISRFGVTLVAAGYSVVGEWVGAIEYED